MSTQLIDGVGIFDLTHEDYLANLLRDCESWEWSKFMAGYTSKNRNANKALTNHVSTFQDFIKGSDRAQEIRRIKEHEDALVQIAKKTHNRKGYATYLNATHLYTFPAAELIERENSDWQTIQRIGAKSYNSSAERKVSDFITEWKNSDFRPAAEEKLKAIRKAIREAEASRLRALEDAAWANATTISTVEAYLSSYPKGRYIAAASELLGNLRREQKDQEDKTAYFGANSLDELRAYLKDWPSGSYRLQAEERITLKVKQDLDKRDREAWQACKSKSDFEAYLKNWPQGRFRQDAEQCLQEIEIHAEAQRKDRYETEWTAAESADTIDAYRRFSKSWPSTEHATHAQGRMAALVISEKIDDLYKSFEVPFFTHSRRREYYGVDEGELKLNARLTSLLEHETGPEKPVSTWVNINNARRKFTSRGRAIATGVGCFEWSIRSVFAITEFLEKRTLIGRWRSEILSLIFVVLTVVNLSVAFEVLQDRLWIIIAVPLTPFLAMLNAGILIGIMWLTLAAFIFLVAGVVGLLAWLIRRFSSGSSSRLARSIGDNVKTFDAIRKGQG